MTQVDESGWTSQVGRVRSHILKYAPISYVWPYKVCEYIVERYCEKRLQNELYCKTDCENILPREIRIL